MQQSDSEAAATSFSVIEKSFYNNISAFLRSPLDSDYSIAELLNSVAAYRTWMIASILKLIDNRDIIVCEQLLSKIPSDFG